MKIQFESALDYQQDAIAAVVDIFKGQEVCAGNFTVFSAEYIARHQNSLALNEIGYANKLELTPGQLLANVQAIQQRNHLKNIHR